MDFPHTEELDRCDPETGLPLFALMSPWCVSTGRVMVLIKPGYLSDLASIPKTLQSVFAANDPKTMPAALAHDALYAARGGTVLVHHITLRFSNPLTRKECDAVLYELMRRQGCSRLRCSIYWIAVRLFGGRHWKG